MDNLLIVFIFQMIIGTVIAHFIGRKRQIGFGWSLFFSFFPNFIIGLVITLFSKSIKEPPPIPSKIKVMIGWALIIWFSLAGLLNIFLLLRDGINIFNIYGIIGGISFGGLGYYLTQLGKGITFNHPSIKSKNTTNRNNQNSNIKELEVKSLDKITLLDKLKSEGNISEKEFEEKSILLKIELESAREKALTENRKKRIDDTINVRMKKERETLDDSLKAGLLTKEDYELKIQSLFDKISHETKELYNSDYMDILNASDLSGVERMGIQKIKRNMTGGHILKSKEFNTIFAYTTEEYNDIFTKNKQDEYIKIIDY